MATGPVTVFATLHEILDVTLMSVSSLQLTYSLQLKTLIIKPTYQFPLLTDDALLYNSNVMTQGDCSHSPLTTHDSSLYAKLS